MKFEKKAKEHVNDIVKYIESLGGVKTCTASSGSVYCELSPIKKIRIADHLSSKSKFEYLHIIIQKENRRYKYICIFCRNIIILSNVGQVKQYIKNIYFVFNTLYLTGFKIEAISDLKIESIKNDILIKDNKLRENKKEIDKLNNIIKSKDEQIAKIKKQLETASTYHNKWQQAESTANKLHKKVEKLLEKLHEQDIQTGENMG